MKILTSLIVRVLVFVFLISAAESAFAQDTYSCDESPDYYKDRFNSCMATDSRGRSYCAGWMGCSGCVDGTVAGRICDPDSPEGQATPVSKPTCNKPAQITINNLNEVGVGIVADLVYGDDTYRGLRHYMGRVGAGKTKTLTVPSAFLAKSPMFSFSATPTHDASIVESGVESLILEQGRKVSPCDTFNLTVGKMWYLPRQ